MSGKIGSDLKAFVNEHITDIAKNHLDGWSERYRGKSKKDIEFDLRVNHDNGSEVTYAEDWLGREFSSDEFDWYEEQFIKAVLRNR